MKKCGIILMILLLCASLPLVKTNAQKTSKIERLLEYLVADDTVKFQKNRGKLDVEIADIYPDELALVDAINELWNGKNAAIIPEFLTYYQLGAENMYPVICQKAKIDPEVVRTRSTETILEILAASFDKLTFSRQLLDTIANAHYPLTQQEQQTLYDIREAAMLNAIQQGPQTQWCETYLKEFPQGRFLYQVVNRYDEILFQVMAKNPTPDNFKAYFGNATINTFFGNPANRRTMTMARSLYDDYLYRAIGRAQELPALKSSIDSYRTDSVLSTSDRKYLAVLEYKTDSVDYEVLKTQVTDADKLSLIKEYLETHRYKEFRDKAVALRAAFEEHLVWKTPAFTYTYNKGQLVESGDTLAVKSVKSTFTDKNGLAVDSIRYEDGRVLLKRYDAQGKVAAEQSFAGGKLVQTVDYQYGDKGELVKGVYAYAMPDGLQPDYVIAQTETYEYDPYGYLKQRSVEKVMANNAKSQSVLTCLYDRFGNPIDSNAYYEYDHTGRWIRKTDIHDPSHMEYIQCIYK